MKKIIFLIILLLLIVAFTLSSFRGRAYSVKGIAYSTSLVLSHNCSDFDTIFMSLFDQAKGCKDKVCQKEISDKINNLSISFKSIPIYEGTYYIREKDGNIEKLFLDGSIKITPIKTLGERIVSFFLLHPMDFIYLPGFKVDSNISSMHFLGDFYSEAEIIVPYSYCSIGIEGKSAGAVVKNYGD